MTNLGAKLCTQRMRLEILLYEKDKLTDVIEMYNQALDQCDERDRNRRNAGEENVIFSGLANFQH